MTRPLSSLAPLAILVASLSHVAQAEDSEWRLVFDVDADLHCRVEIAAKGIADIDQKSLNESLAFFRTCFSAQNQGEVLHTENRSQTLFRFQSGSLAASLTGLSSLLERNHKLELKKSEKGLAFSLEKNASEGLERFPKSIVIRFKGRFVRSNADLVSKGGSEHEWMRTDEKKHLEFALEAWTAALSKRDDK